MTRCVETKSVYVSDGPVVYRCLRKADHEGDCTVRARGWRIYWDPAAKHISQKELIEALLLLGGMKDDSGEEIA